MNGSLSFIFPQQVQALAHYPASVHRAKHVQRSPSDPLVSCPCARARSYYHLCLPAGFTQRQRMDNEQVHLEEPLSTGRAAAAAAGMGARGQARVGSSRKEPLHQKLKAGCFLPQALGQCPCRCLPGAPLLFSAISRGQWGRPWQCPRPSHQTRSSLRLSGPHGVPGGSSHFLPVFSAKPWLPGKG